MFIESSASFPQADIGLREKPGRSLFLDSNQHKPQHIGNGVLFFAAISRR